MPTEPPADTEGPTPPQNLEVNPLKRLTEQQLLFCHHLANDPKGNATEAARQAGYSEKSARYAARDLLDNPTVMQYYQQLVDQRMAQYDVTEDKICRYLAYIAFGDKRRVRQWADGEIVVTPSDELFPEDEAMVKRVDFHQTEFGPRPEVIFYSRKEALDSLAKIKGLMREKIDLGLDVQFSEAARWLEATLDEMDGDETEGGSPEAPSSST